jgi:hypothetical protein
LVDETLLSGLQSSNWWIGGDACSQAQNAFNRPLFITYSYICAVWGGSLFRIAISAIPFLLPLLFQVAFGMSAFSSGLLILAVFAGNLAMKTITTPVIRRFGFRWVLIVNGLLTAVSLFACSFLSPETPMMVIIAVLFFGGLCRSMQFTSLNTLGFSDIPSSHMSATTTFYSMVTQLTMGMGIAAGAIGLRTASLLRGDSTGTPNLMDFHISFGLIAAISLVSVFDFLKLEPGAGSVVSGHKLRTKRNELQKPR